LRKNKKYPTLSQGWVFFIFRQGLPLVAGSNLLREKVLTLRNFDEIFIVFGSVFVFFSI